MQERVGGSGDSSERTSARAMVRDRGTHPNAVMK